ncbi:hypothetical protein JB92DRAFT_2854209 [Gautieria morchelliformis]|nr:hypothetical protein JB92DRAFT_2854209 [Gautieria morchelliformis]
MICITCGARNEHSSGSCPILRHCWNCKAKGHLAKDCPRLGNMSLQQLNREDCERCGSWKHHGTNCPSLWRIYTYLTAADREAVLVDRESKRDLAFDNGGEGYIAHDHWCYNCGESGHLGDDCKEASHNHDQPNEYSAFGSFNKLSGPFASSSYVVPKFERPPREWEKGDRFDDGYGFSADNNVGKRGRENAKAKAREAHRIAEEGNDEIDWFDMNRAGSTKESAKAKHFSLPPKPPPPTVRFGARDSSSFSKPPLDSGNHARHPSQPSLRDRIDMDDRQPTEYSHRYRDRREMSRRDRRREESESRRRDRAYYSSRDDEPRRHHGSRWRGGYDR